MANRHESGGDAESPDKDKGVFEVEAIVGKRIFQVRHCFSASVVAQCMDRTGAQQYCTDGPVRCVFLPATLMTLRCSHSVWQGRTQYLIKWANWPEEANTWEDEKCVVCSNSLRALIWSIHQKSYVPG